MEVNFDKINLGELLTNPLKSGPMTLRVPQFQRKYVWGKEDEVLRLLDDFFGNLGEQYFFGPVIIRYKPSESSNIIDIVDGQQRMVTFCLLIRALLDILELKKKDADFPTSTKPVLDDFRASFKRLIFTGDVLNPQPRVRISQRINSDFRKYILMSDNPDKYQELRKGKKGEHPAYRAIRQALLRIYDYLQDFLTEYKSEKNFQEIINKILNSLENKQLFLLISVEDYADAFTIFESINALGKGLTIPDLVKNLSFKHLYDAYKHDQAWLDDMESEWDDVESQVPNFANFIYHLWVSMNGTCPKNKVYKNLEKQFKGMSVTDNETFVVITIPEEASAYSAYENPTSQAEIEYKYYSALKSLRATRCYPILLSLDWANREKRIDKQNHLDFVKILTSLTFWYSGICENDAKRLEREYHSIAKELRNRSDPTSIQGFIRILKNYFPDEKICKQNFVSNKFTDASLTNLILRSTEQYLRVEKDFEIRQPRLVHIEHILPLSPSQDSEWWSLFDKTQHEEYKSKIGNLTLLDGKKNRAISNRSFQIKRDKYKDSALLLTKDIAQIDTWDMNAIQNRCLQLYEYAKKIWPFPQ